MIPPKGDENNSSSGSNPSIPSDLIMIPPKGDENYGSPRLMPYIRFDNDSPERGRERSCKNQIVTKPLDLIMIPPKGDENRLTFPAQ